MNKEAKVRLFKNHIERHIKATAKGLIGVDPDKIQLDNKTFNEIFENEEVKEEKKVEYLWKYGKKEGVDFISLFPLPKEER
jgi:propanediol utilization protein